MEVPGGLRNKKHILLNELLGTAFLLITVNWGQDPLLVSTVVIVIVAWSGGVGGANINPAVSLGILIKEKDNKNAKIIYYFQIVIA